MAGLTSTGFEIKDLDTILTEIETEEKNLLGQSLVVRPTSVTGVINGIFSSKLSEMWEVAEEVNAAQNPDDATGTSLDQLCMLTGVVRLAATKSSVSLSLTGTPGTSIAVGRRVKNTSTSTYWTNAASGVIGAASTVAITFDAEEFGPTIGLAATLTIIDTPVAGWTSVSNPLDATLGRNVETDQELRLRRTELLTAQGKGTVDAIRADVLAVADVTAAFVYENYTAITDADGVPSKAFEVIVLGGTSNALAQAIWNSKPAGISAYGTSTGTATDALNTSRVVAFTRPTSKTVYLALTATTGTGWAGATSAIAAALTAYGGTLTVGDDVYRSRLYDPALDISGVVDITDLRLAFTSSPVGTANLTVTSRELATFDTSRITVALL